MRNILISASLLFFSISANALKIVSVADGNWEDHAVWLGGNIPTASFNDTVIINTCVFINEDIFIQDQGLLIIGDSGKLCGHHNLHLESGSEFDLYSRIYIDSLFVQGYFYLHTLWYMIIKYVHIFPPGHAYGPLGYYQTYFSFVCDCDYDSIPPHPPPPPPDSTDTIYSSDTSEIKDTVQIDVGPSPFTDWIHVKVRGVIDEVYLTDDIGRLILKRKFESNELQLGFLAPGIYFLNFIVADGRIFTKKIVKRE